MVDKTQHKLVPSPDEFKASKARPTSSSETEAKARSAAQFATLAPVNAAAVLQTYGAQPFGADLDTASLAIVLAESMQQVSNGDMKTAEAMLMGQAMALQTMFVHMARRVLMQPLQHNLESFYAMAMRAQNQCRMKLETLSAIKNPRQVAFVRQTNVAGGHQQINNGVPTNADLARAPEAISRPNELLGVRDDERVDNGEASAAKGANTQLDAVGTVHRAKDASR